MSFQVDRAGPLSLIQDYGRWGAQARGVGVGGPADEHAFVWANYLLGNDHRAAALEVTLGPLQLTARANTMFALTGAEMQASLNGVRLANWSSHYIQAGDVLQLSVPACGLRSYLAVAGGFVCPQRFGSCSSVIREALGGISGRGEALKAGDMLECRPARKLASRKTPPAFIPDYAEPLSLGLLPGYQYRDFDPGQVQCFLGGEYRVAAASNRMGYQLEGPEISAPQMGLISEGISLGAIQLPPSGQPIVLLQDRQTMGGYPKLGCISALDASRLAQRRPGSILRFVPGELEAAIAEREQFNRFFGIGSLQ